MSIQQSNSKKPDLPTRDLAVLAIAAVLLLLVQVALGFLPNIELVSLLIIVYTLVFGRKTLYIIYTFALLEGLFYGFGVWWIAYLYIWTILFGIVYLLRANQSTVIWSLIGGFFGLGFGALCAIPYGIAGGLGSAITWWVSGIPFDIAHGVGNFIIILVLFKPIYQVTQRLA